MTLRTIGTETQAAIDSQEFTRSFQVWILNDDATESTLPIDHLKRTPRLETSLDTTTWRAQLSILNTADNAANLVRGRRIAIDEYFAPGEGLSLFVGYIRDVKPGLIYSNGVIEATLELECYGENSRRFEGHATRFDWAPTLLSPSDIDEDGTGKLRVTGIVKRFRVTSTPNPYSATNVSPTAVAASYIDLASATGFSSGDFIWIYYGNRCQMLQIDNVAGNRLNLKADYNIDDPTYYTAGFAYVTKSAGLIPILNLPFFPDNNVDSWVDLYEDDGTTPATAGTYRDDVSGIFTAIFGADPGATFTAEIYAVDRWVILLNRYYGDVTNGANFNVPYYYILSGVVGDSGTERLNDRAMTTVSSVTSDTVFKVADPSGIFASSASPTVDRWISVWSAGVEYRGKVSAVDKSGGADHGKVTLDASYKLKNYQGTILTPTVGLEAGNTSSAHYEILNPWGQFVTYDSGGTFYAGFLKAEPVGGYMFLGQKAEQVYNVTPGYDQDLTSLANAWQFYIDGDRIVVALAAGDYNPGLNESGNDVVEALRDLLEEASAYLFDTWEASGFTLAPFTRAQVTIGAMIDEIRQAAIPPNWRLQENEDGQPIGRYIAQLDEPEMTIRGVKSFTPREFPQPLTRVIVKGRQSLVNRAGQLYRDSTNLMFPNKIFDGFRDTYGAAGEVAQGVDNAIIYFKIPACEPGRYPNLGKVVVSHDSSIFHWVTGWPTLAGDGRAMPTGVVPNNGAETFVRKEYTDGFEAIAKGDSDPWDEWNLIVIIGGNGYIDEIEVYLKEGPYFEVQLTDDTDLAPADGPDGVNGFGASYNQPDRTLSIAYRYAPTNYLNKFKIAAMDRVKIVDAESVTQAQAQEVAQAYLDVAVRGAEFYEVVAPYDPRVRTGMTVAVPYATLNEAADGSLEPVSASKTLLVWGMVKGEQDMTLTLADYSL